MASAAKKEPVKKTRDDAEDSAGAAPAVAPKRGRGGVLMVFGAALVAATLASGATWLLLPKVASHAAAKGAAAADQAPAGDGAATDVSNEPPATYLELTPAFVVNLADEESMRFLQVTVEVMARDPKVIDAVKTHTPRIRNALMLLFSQQSSHTIAGRDAKEALQKKALDEVQKALQAENAPADVSAVYFTSLVMQ